MVPKSGKHQDFLKNYETRIVYSSDREKSSLLLNVQLWNGNHSLTMQLFVRLSCAGRLARLALQYYSAFHWRRWLVLTSAQPQDRTEPNLFLLRFNFAAFARKISLTASQKIYGLLEIDGKRIPRYLIYRASPFRNESEANKQQRGSP